MPGPVRWVTALLLFLPMCGPLCAEEAFYVSDQVALKMYKNSALSEALPPLKPGDQVQILKRDDGYSEVKLTDGTQGWVRSSRLVSDKPAVVRIEEIRKELDSLRSKHADLLLEQDIAVAAGNLESVQRAEAAEAARDELQGRVAELEAENARQLQQLRGLRHMADISESRDLLLWAILPLLALISGFFIGFKYLEAKIKARFGGHNPF